MKRRNLSGNFAGKLLIAGIALLFITLPLTASAQDEVQSKLGIRPSGSGSSSSTVVNQQGDLQIELRADKPSYRVNEAISFSIKGNKTFYLYLFSISEKGEAIMLIPGPEQKGNKYNGNKSYRVPNPGHDFFADRPGRERIVLVASTKWLDPGTKQYKSKGGFYTASAEVAESTVKGLRISSRQQKASHVTREAFVDIH